MDKMDIKASDWEKATWKIHLNLDMPLLNPPAVQWAIFDEDPIARFKESLHRMEEIFQSHLAEIEDDAMREHAMSSQLSVTWDLMFRSVTGDKVYLLTSVPGIFHMVSSNESPGKKWVVSKVVQIGEEPYCWSVSFDAVIGEVAEIKLTKDNALHLDSMVDDLA